MKYIEFKQIPFEGKTKRFNIVSISSGDILGRVQFYPQWRQYIFTPSHPTIWNSDCLMDIQVFLNTLNDERRT